MLYLNCVKPSGYCMYRTVVTVCTAQWLPYVPPGLTFNNSTFCPHSVFMCFVWISEQTAIISRYSINWLVFITETECVYCAVRAKWLHIIHCPPMLSTHFRLLFAYTRTNGRSLGTCNRKSDLIRQTSISTEPLKTDVLTTGLVISVRYILYWWRLVGIVTGNLALLAHATIRLRVARDTASAFVYLLGFPNVSL